jgi:hypothetical protein
MAAADASRDLLGHRRPGRGVAHLHGDPHALQVVTGVDDGRARPGVGADGEVQRVVVARRRHRLGQAAESVAAQLGAAAVGVVQVHHDVDVARRR